MLIRHGKKLITLACAFVMACALPSLLGGCKEQTEENAEFANWQPRNKQYWDSLYNDAQAKIKSGDSSWKIIANWSLNDSVAKANTDYIIVHETTKGAGTISPFYTDSVRVNYWGRLIPTASYPEGYLFDKSYSDDFNPNTSIPAKFKVSGLTDGFATALQHMHIGDEWDVYVPWTLAYGTAGSGSILGYSVLKFHIHLVGIYRAGTSVPTYQAKGQWVSESVVDEPDWSESQQ